MRAGVVLVVLIGACSERSAAPITPSLAARDAAAADSMLVIPAPEAPAKVADAAPAPATAPSVPPPLATLRSLPGIDIVASTNFAQHVHGGPGATIDAARVNVEVRDRKPHAILVEQVELLHASCREKTWSSRSRKKIVGYELFDWTHSDPIDRGTGRATLPAVPARYQMSVKLEPFSEYQACDRTAFAIRLVVDGARVDVEAPLQIKRFEPLRRP